MYWICNQVDVFFNQKPVSPPNNAYAYRSYIETLLNYGSAAKNFISLVHYGTPTPLEKWMLQMTKTKAFQVVETLWVKRKT